jgi:hypothetical protein
VSPNSRQRLLVPLKVSLTFSAECSICVCNRSPPLMCGRHMHLSAKHVTWFSCVCNHSPPLNVWQTHVLCLQNTSHGFRVSRGTVWLAQHSTCVARTVQHMKKTPTNSNQFLSFSLRYRCRLVAYANSSQVSCRSAAELSPRSFASKLDANSG